MVGISYTNPGFPVYRVLMTPVLVNGKFENVLEVNENVIRSWENVLQGLREYLLTYHSIIENLKNKPVGYEYLETLADIVSLYFRQPLQLDPIPSTMVSPLRIYSAVRKTGLIRDIYKEDPVDTLRSLTNISSEEHKSEIIENLTNCWLSLPADTRPGHNTSGLIPHLLTTSSIAWALAVESGFSRTEAAKVRLAALLHDMSKPFNYRRHWEITDRIVDLVFDREVLGSDLVDELTQLVRRHHLQSGDMLGNIIHRADVIASSVDRLRRLTKETLKKEVGDRFEILYGAGEESWEEWAKLETDSPGKIKELSLKFLEKAKKIEPGWDAFSEVGGLLYFLVDVGGIQEFIFRTVDLRTVAASSYMVDFLISAYLLMSMQHHLETSSDVWVPVEVFMVNGGGNLSFIAPASLRKEVMECLGSIRRKLEERLGLRLYFDSSNLTDDFTVTSSKAAAAVSLQKIRHAKHADGKTISSDLCNYCYTNTVDLPDEKSCRVCGDLHEIGNEFHFKKKWDAELVLLPENIKIGGIKACYEPKMDLMYLIAGHSPNELEEIQKGEGRKRNAAVIKFDANMMGRFFTESISLTDAIERSWRVDMAMKLAYQKALCELYKAVRDCDGVEQAELAVRQCYLGTLYIGGDDGLVICPSWAAIPLVVGISRYFNEKMGGVLTLSVGLVATPPEHDVWSSIEAASASLNMAKDLGRKIKTPSDGFGALSYDIIEGGTLSKSAVKSRYSELRKEGLTVQPFILGGNDKVRTIDTMLENILEVGTGDLSGLYKKCWEASHGESGEEGKHDLKDILKRIRSSLKEPPEIVRNSKELIIKMSFTYFSRQISRVEEKADPSAKAYKIVANSLRQYLLGGGEDLQTPIADIDRLIKIVGGGVI